MPGEPYHGEASFYIHAHLRLQSLLTAYSSSIQVRRRVIPFSCVCKHSQANSSVVSIAEYCVFCVVAYTKTRLGYHEVVLTI